MERGHSFICLNSWTVVMIRRIKWPKSNMKSSKRSGCFPSLRLPWAVSKGRAEPRRPVRSGMASSYATNLYGSSVPDTLASNLQKKLPALTTAQARQLVAPTIADETRPFQDGLASINYHQQRNYAAYRSHRKHGRNRHHRPSTKMPRRKTS